MSDAIPSDPSANEDDIDLSALPNAELVAQMHDDLYDGLIVLVGSAPLNEEFGQAIGADAYCRDALAPQD